MQVVFIIPKSEVSNNTQDYFIYTYGLPVKKNIHLNFNYIVCCLYFPMNLTLSSHHIIQQNNLTLHLALVEGWGKYKYKLNICMSVNWTSF